MVSRAAVWPPGFRRARRAGACRGLLRGGQGSSGWRPPGRPPAEPLSPAVPPSRAPCECARRPARPGRRPPRWRSPPCPPLSLGGQRGRHAADARRQHDGRRRWSPPTPGRASCRSRPSGRRPADAGRAGRAAGLEPELSPRAPARGGVEVEATGAMAQGLEVEQTGPGGLVTAQCGAPGTSFWFVGPGQASAGDDRAVPGEHRQPGG